MKMRWFRKDKPHRQTVDLAREDLHLQVGASWRLDKTKRAWSLPLSPWYAYWWSHGESNPDCRLQRAIYSWLQRIPPTFTIIYGRLRPSKAVCFDFSDVHLLYGIVYGGQVFLNGVPDVVDGFGLGTTLGPASGQTGAGNAKSFLRLIQNDFVFHRSLSKF